MRVVVVALHAFDPCHDLHPLSTRIEIITANGLPIAEGRSEVFINPLITGD
jgi:hypothetical protein